MGARGGLLAPFGREALLQRVHEVDDIRGTLRPRHLDLLALGLLIDDLSQRRLVAVLSMRHGRRARELEGLFAFITRLLPNCLVPGDEREREGPLQPAQQKTGNRIRYSKVDAETG